MRILKTLLLTALILSPVAAIAQSNVPPHEVTQHAPELAPHGSQPQPAGVPATTESLELPAVAAPNAEAQEAAKRREAAKILKEQKKQMREQKRQERAAEMEKKKAEREAKRAERKKKAEERDAKRKEKMKQNLPKFGRPDDGSGNTNQNNNFGM